MLILKKIYQLISDADPEQEQSSKSLDLCWAFTRNIISLVMTYADPTN
jgi:hypothetical protein